MDLINCHAVLASQNSASAKAVERGYEREGAEALAKCLGPVSIRSFGQTWQHLSRRLCRSICGEAVLHRKDQNSFAAMPPSQLCVSRNCGIAAGSSRAAPEKHRFWHKRPASVGVLRNGIADRRAEPRESLEAVDPMNCHAL